MISINKQGNAIVIEFTDNDKYLFNGKIEVAPNELIVVTDDSKMATFRKASNGDVLFSQLISDIQIAGSPVTQDTIIDQFATIGFISGEDAVTSVNGQTGEVVLTASSLNAYTKTQTDDLVNGVRTIANDANNKADAVTSRVQNVETSLGNKQDTLVSGTNIKTINGDSILGSGNLVIQRGTSNWDDIQGKPQFARVATSGDYNDLINKPTIPDVSGLATKEEIADMETKSNAAATYATKQEIPSLEGYLTETVASETYATKQEIAGKQDTLVSGTNIKTINGNSILGEGNIEITSGSKVWTATANKSIRVDTSLNGAISLSNWTGYRTAKPGDVVHITYSNYNWNLVVTGRYKDNNGTYLALSGLGDLQTGYRISDNLMYSYVPFDKNMDAAIVIGRGAYANAGTKYEVAIGVGAATNGRNAVAIGAYGATANANATAVGSQADANEDGSTVIGSNLKANKQDGSTPEKVLVGYYDTANSTSVPVLAYNESEGARIKSGSSLKSIATTDQLPKLVTLTQSEYDALTTKDENTYYFIKEA